MATKPKSDEEKEQPEGGSSLPLTMESLRGKTPDELVQMVTVLDAHLRSLHESEEGELRSLDEDEQKAFDLGLQIREKAMAMLDEHKRVAEIFSRRPKAVESALNIIRFGAEESHDVRRLTNSEVRNAALRRLDDREAAGHLRSDQKEQVSEQ